MYIIAVSDEFYLSFTVVFNLQKLTIKGIKYELREWKTLSLDYLP